MTSKHFLLLVLFSCFIATRMHAQYNRPANRIWAMGNLQGLDFSNGTPVPVKTALSNGNEACASVCDENGKLLFYTNGQEVWNRTGTPMPHGGSSFLGAVSTLSTTQGAAIVPVPDSTGKYYLFSLAVAGGAYNQLYCSKIDVDMDNGLGDVDTTFYLWKVAIDSNLTEKMITVAGCNNNVWLMLHEKRNTSFKAYEITAAGISAKPVISNVGSLPGYEQGVLKISPDRKKLLTCNFESFGASKGAEVFDFDYRTGILSNPLRLDTISKYYGGAFSPDNSKVYAQSVTTSEVYQFDLNDPDPAQTKTLLGPSGQYADMKLGPDGKIYFGAEVGSPKFNNYRYMGCINDPDKAGLACNFQDSVTALLFLNAAGTGGGLSQGLPNEVAVPVHDVDTLFVNSLDTFVCTSFAPFELSAPGGADQYIWDDGSSDSVRTVTQRGTYWVLSFNPCPRIDTFKVEGVTFPAWTITVTGHTLGTSPAFDTYQWYKNGKIIDTATHATYTVLENGWYSVMVGLSGCTDSLGYLVTNITAIERTAKSGDKEVSIYPNPATAVVTVTAAHPVNIVISSIEGKIMLLQQNTQSIDVSSLAKGLYMMRITNKEGMLLKTEKLIKQ